MIKKLHWGLNDMSKTRSEHPISDQHLSNKSLSASQIKILHLLKQQGNLTVSKIAPQLNMTSMGARQHIETLETQGYIEHLFSNEGRGRPKKYWQITDKGQTQFPDGHANLIANLLGHMQQQLGNQAVDDLIVCRESEMLRDYLRALSPLSDLADKLKKLVELRTEEGYMASVEKTSTGWRLIENHCPICSAAKQCQQFCRSEKSIFETVLQAKIERSEYILEGDRRCCYLVSDTFTRN